jgi:hypothetical protein
LKNSNATRDMRNVRRAHEKTHRADSESGFLATKLFSWIFAFGPINARIGGCFGTSLRRFAESGFARFARRRT